MFAPMFFWIGMGMGCASPDDDSCEIDGDEATENKEVGVISELLFARAEGGAKPASLGIATRGINLGRPCGVGSAKAMGSQLAWSAPGRFGHGHTTHSYPRRSALRTRGTSANDIYA